MPVFETLNAANLAIEVNHDYATANSIDKARKYRDALEALIVFRAESMSKTGGTSEEARFNHAALIAAQKRVEKWLAYKNANSSRGRWRQFITKCQTR